MKKKTSLATIVLVIIMTITATAGTIHAYSYYKKLVNKKKIGCVREYWTESLTEKTLKNRGDDIIIEKMIGTVTNKKKDGKLLESGDYINYKSVRKAKKGDIILTILIYKPCSKSPDEIINRIDYIIDRKR